MENISYNVNYIKLYESITSKIPSDKETLLKSFKQDISEDMFAPTQEFLETSYNLFNEKFFNNSLPERLLFMVSNAPRARYMGLAGYRINNYAETIIPTYIKLNSSRKMTVHNWLEVVLHEIIHILDYQTNPSHFLYGNKNSYDSHGSWFLNKGKEFESEGFHVQKYCNSNQTIDTDNPSIKNKINNMRFILASIGQRQAIFVVSDKTLENHINILGEVSKYRVKDMKLQKVLKSSNPDVLRLKSIRMKNYHSGYSWYWFTEDFQKKYGPFEEISEINTSNVQEDRDETDYEEMNHIDDEYAKQIYDHITNVVEVNKVKDGVYDVGIA